MDNQRYIVNGAVGHHADRPYMLASASELEQAINSRISELQRVQIEAQSRFATAYESFGILQPLLSKLRANEASFDGILRRNQMLERLLEEERRKTADKAAEAQNLAIALAEKTRAQDMLVEDRRLKMIELELLTLRVNEGLAREKASTEFLEERNRRLMKQEEELKGLRDAGARLWKGKETADAETREARAKLLEQEKASAQRISQVTREYTETITRVEGEATTLREKLSNALEEVDRGRKSHEAFRSGQLVTIKTQQEKIEALSSGMLHAKREADTARSEVNALTQELEKLKSDVEEREIARKQESAQRDEILATAFSQATAVKEQLQRANERVENVEQRADDLQHSKEEDEKKISQLRFTMHKNQLRYTAQIYGLQHRQKEAEEQKNSISSQLASKETEFQVTIDDLKSTITNLDQELQDSKSKLVDAEQLLEKSRKELKEALEQVDLAKVQAKTASGPSWSEGRGGLAKKPEDIPTHTYEMQLDTENPISAPTSNPTPYVPLPHPIHGRRANWPSIKSAPPPPADDFNARRVAMLLKTVKDKNDLIERHELELVRLKAALENQPSDINPLSISTVEPLRDHNYIITKPQVQHQDLKPQQAQINANGASAMIDVSAGTAGLRLRELEEKKRDVEKRLRDAVEENMELRERAENFDEVQASLRATKEVLKNVEARLREAVDENADLRRRVNRW